MAKNKKSFGFTLNKITTEQYAQVSEPPAKQEKISLSTEFKFGFNHSQRAIGAFTNFRFDNDGEPFLLLEVACHFQIEEESWNAFIDKENNHIVLPKDFAAHLLMITVGTARGVLHSKTENSSYNEFFIPLLNVAKLINSDIIENINDDTSNKDQVNIPELENENK